jgi:hypothetical protein
LEQPTDSLELLIHCNIFPTANSGRRERKLSGHTMGPLSNFHGIFPLVDQAI